MKRLEEVAEIIMGTSPAGDTYNRNGIGLPLLNGPTEFGNVCPHSTLYTTDSKKECKTGDLIFCVRGNTTGRMNWADKKYSLGRGVCAIRGKTVVETNYIKKCLEVYLPNLLQLASGATMPNLTQSSIKQFSIPYPESRDKIAAILSAYDDLIENNLRRIKILEEMAQNLYREWFVNFRFPGHENTRFVDSPLGKIPEGWEVKDLIDFGEIITGKTPSKIRLDYYGDDVPFIKLPDMHNNIYCTQTIDNLSKSGADSQKSKTLPPNSLCVSCIGTVGKVAITAFKSQTNQQINSIIPYRRENLEFLFFSLLGLKEKIELYSATGATMNNLSRGKFISLRVITPSEILIKEYHDLVSPIFRAILNLQLKNEMLKKTRDLLLPKLISGEVDVSELDIKVPEEVAI